MARLKWLVKVMAVPAAVLLLAASGYVHGLQTDRWGTSADVLDAVARLERLPDAIGPWRSEAVEIPQRQLDMAGALGCFARHYVNREDGRAVSVVLLCGRPGPIATHPPTVCFTGSGWEMLSTPSKQTFAAPPGDAENEFWEGAFTREIEGTPVRMQTLWSWGPGDEWKAADSPRREFAGSGHLYKLYISTLLPMGPENAKEFQAADFVNIFLPAAGRALTADK